MDPLVKALLRAVLVSMYRVRQLHVLAILRPEVTERIVHQCRDAGVRRVWMHRPIGREGIECLAGSSRVLPSARYHRNCRCLPDQKDWLDDLC
jgi:hypothetical protein